jgi:hypothetical protein
MERGNGVLYEFVDGFVGAALDILLNRFLKFWPKANFHGGIVVHAAVSTPDSEVLGGAALQRCDRVAFRKRL